MNEPATTTTDFPAVPPTKAERRSRRKTAKRRPGGDDPPAPKRNEFAGVSATKCCDGCTEERCVISTINVCKHPFKTGDSGCGPITLKNREAVRRIVKRQKSDA